MVYLSEKLEIVATDVKLFYTGMHIKELFQNEMLFNT